MPVKVESTSALPGLSPVSGKAIVARFDAACMSWDGGLLALREIEQRLAIASRLAACIHDLRDPSRVVHGLDEIIRTRMLMIAAGYEDGNDADRLRSDPMFKLAMGRLPDDADLCSQPTISRLENLPDARALLRMARAMVDHYCQSFRHVPRHIVLDIDDTFDAVHGGQQLRLFNAHYDEYGFQPIVVFDGDGRMIAAVLRPASRPSGKQIVRWLHRLITAIGGNWPQVQIMLRADSHYCTPEVLRFCRARGLDYTLGVAPTWTLRKHVLSLEESTAARAAATTDGSKLRRFKEFYDGAASWDRVERIIARVEAGPQGPDTRFIVTSLSRPSGRTVYQDIYCARGQAENHIKAWKNPSGCRSHLVLPSERQPNASLPPYWRLLADVELANADATPVSLAGCSVRYLAATSDQTGRQHQGVKDTDPVAPATCNAASGAVCVATDPHAPSQHLTRGRDCPTSPNADQLQRPPDTKTTQRTRKRADPDLWSHSLRLSDRHRSAVHRLSW